MKPKSSFALSLGMLALAGVAMAQDQAPQTLQTPQAPQAPHQWRSVNDPPPANVAADPAPGPQAPVDQPQNQGFPADAQNAPAPPPPPDNQQAAPPAPPPAPNFPPAPAVPPQLTIKQGSYIIVRINQWLSSDRNQVGDKFTATLEQPVVVDGFVVAPRGATVIGTVTQAKKAGRAAGTSQLGVALTELTLMDGQQIPIQSQMISRNGPTSYGRDAAAIGGTTAVGAAIGAGVGWGTGAAIGAGAGAAAGIIGVLLTRGQPTVIYPESVLTFQTTAPATFATDRAPLAFQPVSAQPNYGSYGQYQPGPAPPPAGAPYPYATAPVAPPPYGYGYGYPVYPYAYGYPYGYYPYYPFYGGFGVYFGGRYGYFGGYRGGYRGGFRR